MSKSSNSIVDHRAAPACAGWLVDRGIDTGMTTAGRGGQGCRKRCSVGLRRERRRLCADELRHRRGCPWCNHRGGAGLAVTGARAIVTWPIPSSRARHSGLRLCIRTNPATAAPHGTIELRDQGRMVDDVPRTIANWTSKSRALVIDVRWSLSLLRFWPKDMQRLPTAALPLLQ